MESFAALKRRTTDLLQSMSPAKSPTSATHQHQPGPKHNTMKGTWERVAIPPLPRSSHSLDVVAGTAYVFGGEVEPRRPVDNDMHALVLPFSGAPADYYAIKAKPAAALATREEEDEEGEGEKEGEMKDVEKELQEISLSSPPTKASASASTSAPTPATTQTAEGKGKGKEGEQPPPPPLGDVPAARVGHATAVIGSRIFMFGGRGGPAMAPLDERGRVWVFDTRTHTWSFLDPAPRVDPNPIALTLTAAQNKPAYPAPRSYHAATATDHPADVAAHPPPRRAGTWKEWVEGDSAEVGTPQRPIVGNVAARARDQDAEGYGTFVVHGGCLAEGRGRASDVWAFDVRARSWRELPPAPGKPRGGAALCISRSRLYRFGGFNGEAEEGGRLDFLELGVDTFDDQTTLAEVMLVARGGWQSLTPDADADAKDKDATAVSTAYRSPKAGAVAQEEEDDDDDDDDQPSSPLQSRSAATKTTTTAAAADDWPGPRSVAGLEAVTVGGGREYLVLMLGERDPSGAGHEAAGKFWGDVWAFQVPPQGLSAASVTDAFVGLLGGRSGEGRWARVETAPYDEEDEDAAEGPGPRGWIATAPMGELEENGIVVFGGLDDANRRLGDAWIFRLG